VTRTLAINVKPADRLAPFGSLETPDFRATLKGYGIDTGAPNEILWNFEKFLVDRNGAVVERFAPDVTPDSELVTSAIERELSR